MFFRRKPRTNPGSQRSQLGGSRASRLSAEAARVREILRPWATPTKELPKGYWPGQRPKDMPRNFFRLIASKWWKPFQDDLGTTHGVGILLLVAKLDTGGTGTLRADEEANFLREVDVMGEQLLGFITTAMVMAMLIVSICIPLCVYQLSTVTPEELIALPSLGGNWAQPPDWYAAWMGSSALHVLYWFEAASLSLTVTLGCQCIMTCNFMYMNLAIVFPDPEYKTYYLVDNIQTVFDCFMKSIGCLQAMMVSLPMLAARISPVAGICICLPAFSMLPLHVTYILGPLSFWWTGAAENMENKQYCSPALMQLCVAREVLLKADAKQGWAVPEPSTATPVVVDLVGSSSPAQARAGRASATMATATM